jgi:hypothetical protein
MGRHANEAESYCRRRTLRLSVWQVVVETKGCSSSGALVTVRLSFVLAFLSLRPFVGTNSRFGARSVPIRIASGAIV